MLLCLVVALSGVAEAFCLSVFFLVWQMRIAITMAARWMERDPDTVLYFGPLVSEAE